MFTFLHPLLLWGLAIIAAPVLIHLINMLRHRRVEWAAMEFLRVSLKKHRTWVLLKQLLLLLLRAMIVAAVVLIVARPRLASQWSGMLGTAKTHHVLLLDDSFSMSDQWGDTSSFARAKRVVERIGGEAGRLGNSEFTLLRFSRVHSSPLLSGEGPGVRDDAKETIFHSSAPHPNPLPKGEGNETAPHPNPLRAPRSGRGEGIKFDFLREPTGNGFTAKLEAALGKIEVSESDAGPAEPLRAVQEVLGQPEGQRRVLYLISDFRTRQWNDPADVKKLLTQWQNAGAEIHLIQCADRAGANLAVASLLPEPGIRVAGVDWFMSVAVTNFHTAPARNVTVFLEQDGQGRPSIQFGEIPPGQTVRQRFPVSFLAPGRHRISARLEGDAVAADNQRFYTVDLDAALPVLLIDGDPRAPDARFLNILFKSGGAARTGLRPVIEMPQALGRKPTTEYAAIDLANVDRLDAEAVSALEKYVREGGGAAFFLGETCDCPFYNRRLYREGQGPFPLPLKGPAELVVDRLQTASDVQPEEHFLFRNFSQKRNNFLQSINVQRYFAAEDGWKPPADGSVRVLARLRSGAPLIVEKQFGKGRVVAFLSSLAPKGNNWAQNPGGAIVLLDLHAYLSQGRRVETPRIVGNPLEVTLDPARYQSRLQFVIPPAVPGTVPATIAADAETPAGRKTGDRLETGPTAPGDRLATGPTAQRTAVLADTGRSGFYEARLLKTNGDPEIRSYAYNVDPAEGNLALLNRSGLAGRLEGLHYQYSPAALFQTADNSAAGGDLWEIILYLLIVLLIGEQILAWSASYHRKESRVRQVGNLSYTTKPAAPHGGQVDNLSYDRHEGRVGNPSYTKAGGGP